MPKVSKKVGSRIQNITGKRHWIHHAQKNRWGEKDIDEKGRLQKLLREYFGLNFNIQNKNDHPIFINKFTGKMEHPAESLSKADILEEYEIFYPDLYSSKNEPLFMVVEIDGPVHWMSSKGIKRTNYRNEMYDRAGIKLLWLTDDEAHEKELRWIISNISEKLGIRPSLQPRKR